MCCVVGKGPGEVSVLRFVLVSSGKGQEKQKPGASAWTLQLPGKLLRVRHPCPVMLASEPEAEFYCTFDSTFVWIAQG